ncbi:MAG: deoxyribodipyrimidine photo-lyase [Phycisphaeraceae bacterium]|nr:deoxyribodipyrimidine photo-lyase [Phycisphaeraceae bacterium]
MTALVWFRADLRIRDNTALAAACRDSDRVVALFTICPDQWREHDWAAVKIDFLLRNLHALRLDLNRLNIPLRLLTAPRFHDLPQAMLRLARTLDARSLYFNREYEHNEVVRDAAVHARFTSAGIAVHPMHDQTLIPPGAARTDAGAWYTVYSPFRRRVAALLLETGIPQPAPAPSPQKSFPCPSDDLPSTLPDAATTIPPDLWPAGETEAHRRLNAFAADAIRNYAERRDYPSDNATSALSPYLALGVLSPRHALEAAIRAGGRLDPRSNHRAGPDVWINELIWREFYKHLLVGFPRLSKSRAFRLETEHIPWSTDRAHFEAWCQGRTGFPIVDAAMRQLLRIGWMHNRCRMITAMFLTKDLFINWQWGERHFMRHLVDGDLAANNGGWQWSASTGTDAAPYFRIFNPVTQGRRYDPSGDYIRTYVPELAHLDNEVIHEPWKLPPLRRETLDYPHPIIDHAQARARAIAAFKAHA